MCSNLGHKNAAVIEAIAEQARKLPYIVPGYATDTRVELSRLLLEVLPEGLTKFFFTTSGTEANEAAFKIARMYTRQDEDHRPLPVVSRVDYQPRLRQLEIRGGGRWSRGARARGSSSLRR